MNDLFEFWIINVSSDLIFSFLIVVPFHAALDVQSLSVFLQNEILESVGESATKKQNKAKQKHKT